MALVFVLPALAILAIVALIIAGYSRRKKANLKFVDADYLYDSEYDKYKADDHETPRKPRNISNLNEVDDVSDFETPSSIIDRALGSVPDEPLTNGTAFFSLPDTSKEFDLQSDEEDGAGMSNADGCDNKIEPAKLFSSPESATSSVTRSSDAEDSPVDLTSTLLDGSPDNIAEIPLYDIGTLEGDRTTGEVEDDRVKVKSVRIDETPNIFTWEENDPKQEQNVVEKDALAEFNEDIEDEDEEAVNLSDIQEEETEDDSVNDASLTDNASGFIGDIVDPITSSNGIGNALAVGRSLFSGVQNDDSVSFLENSVGMSDDSERSALSASQIPRVQVSVAPSLAQSMFAGREASETSSGELSLNF